MRITVASVTHVRVAVAAYDNLLNQANRKLATYTVPAAGGLPHVLAAARAGGIAPWERIALARNGVAVAQEDLARITVEEGDTIVIAPAPKDITGGTLILIAIAIISAAASAYIASQVRAPGVATSNQDPAGTRYLFSRVVSDATAGDPVPQVLGRRVSYGGKVVGKSIAEAEDGSGEQTLKLLIVLGDEGEWAAIGNQTADADDVAASAITGVKINDQPIANFPSTRMSVRMGTSGQAAMPGFDDVEVIREVGAGGAALVNTSGSFRTSGTAVSSEAFLFTTVGAPDAVRVRVRFNAGLYRLNGSGQVEPSTVNYRLRTRLTDAGGGTPGSWSAWTYYGVTRADQTVFYSSPRVATGGNKTDIQVERAAIDATDSTTIDTITWDSLVEITEANETYPGTVLVGMKLVAGQELTGEPKLSFDVKGVKVRVWDGVSDPSTPTFTRAWSDNPAWHALELITNQTWGMGARYSDDDVDFPSLIEWAEYCDELVDRPAGSKYGATRKRFTCGLALMDSKSGDEWLRTICTVGHTTPVIVGNRWRFNVDRPHTTPVEIFTDASRAVSGEGQSRFAESEIAYEPATGGIARANQILVQFDNAEANGEGDAIPYPDDGDEWLADEPVVLKAVSVDGLTDPDQAMSEAIYRAKKERLQARSIAFTTTRPFVVCQPGDRVDVADSVLGWGLASGRTAATGSTDGTANTSTVRLDKGVDLSTDGSGAAWVIELVREDGSIETRTVVSGAGYYAAGTPITVAPALTAPSERGEEWAIAGSTPGLKPFVVTGVEPVESEGLKWRVSAVEYAENVYVDTGPLVDLPDYSTLPGPRKPPGALSSLVAYERETPRGNVIQLAWTQSPTDLEFTARYFIFWRRAGTLAWQLISAASVARTGAVIEIYDEDSAYEFRVVAQSIGGARLSVDYAGHPTAGLSLGLSKEPPAAPTGLTLTQVVGNTYTLAWDAMDGAVGYQVLAGGETTSLPNAGAEDCFVLARTTAAELAGLELPPGAAVRFYVRSVGSNGRMSVASATVNESSPALPAGSTLKDDTDHDLSASGTAVDVTWDGTDNRLELDAPGTPGTPGVWTSDEVDLTTSTDSELTVRILTANDHADPTIDDDPFNVPSLAADQWGTLVSGSPFTVGMLNPPYPDNAQTWLVEVRTHDGTVWSGWSELAPFAALQRTFQKYQVRVTMAQSAEVYRPALRGVRVIVTH